MASVIIPAHNESRVIDRCLSAILKKTISQKNTYEVVVVCNGCSDDTASKARKYPGVTVVEIDEASKVLALNKGDSVAKSYPRVYLDADIEISSQSLHAAIDEVKSSDVLAASPTAKFDLSSSSMLVKCFYIVWTKLPYFTRGKMIGSGIYILSQEGRSRFTEFPNLVSDDGFVRSLFDDSEKKTLAGSQFKIFVPRTVRELIKIKRRSMFGNLQLLGVNAKADVGKDNTVKDIVLLVLRKPWLIPAAVVYILIKLRIATKIEVSKKANDSFVWERDNSSRI